MTDAYLDSPPLTAEQRAVVEQPWDTRLLVTAGAGSGKTHTLVRRLDALMSDEEEALEAREILVLSFSRAAVRELRERIALHAREARRVRVQTFDSWAYAVLRGEQPDRDWSTLRFDERIAEATEAILRGAIEESEQGAPAHVVIDEVQDLVGDRRDMVETLLDRFQDACGFTVVGDGAQAIYGFQVSDEDARAAETNYFFDWLRASYADDLVELHLSANFRARTPEAGVALPLGCSLQRLPSETSAAEAAGEDLHRDLTDLLRGCPSFGTVDDAFTLDSLREFRGTCAILCRDNRQALVLSEKLFAHGVHHRLQRDLRERPVPAWVAAVLRGTGSTTLTEDRFLDLLGSGPLAPVGDRTRIWRSLRGAAGAPRGLVDVSAVRRAVAQGRFPDDLAAVEPADLVVSTVHRAKGLEFDRVIVVEPASMAELRKQHTHIDPAAEARALYVAMTRPRDDLFRLDAPDTALIRRDRRTGRYYVGGWKPYQRYGITAASTDVSREQPPGTDGFECDAGALQDHLAASVAPGDALELRLQHAMPLAPEESPPYTVFHRDRPVAVVSERFRQDLYTSLKINRTWDISWPTSIEGFRVDCLESVAGSTAAGARAGLGEHGIWTVPRLSGLGRYRWTDAHTYEENDR
ncbi:MULTISPECIES: UvrD-helicase domain-containing protein [unclassified Streptomyces]|uniref:UvrD-helicase domain-containing protein n=1 Tax=unclassified Streptomyces TaxID=2593676 RepID=UPI002ED33F52|nr:UvrD-helicase domain-containing protein [Streptomyces sp. NBC_00891]WSY05615.1 UvrD-helicase domain-containing protein [Streptomyces sp. NBC_00890]WSZ07239.1 UvrD-helicase domain-containing protein [Streptomyces sp. NBC_00869]WSZ25262.1 UvrD-helicase domain-containing protein [Streptomyces sp. NBC_00870]